jgi:hypothetical protein
LIGKQTVLAFWYSLYLIYQQYWHIIMRSLLKNKYEISGTLPDLLYKQTKTKIFPLFQQETIIFVTDEYCYLCVPHLIHWTYLLPRHLVFNLRHNFLSSHHIIKHRNLLTVKQYIMILTFTILKLRSYPLYM